MDEQSRADRADRAGRRWMPENAETLTRILVLVLIPRMAVLEDPGDEE